MGNLAKQGSKYSDEDRRRVAVEYLVTGNMKKVAKRVRIPRRTLVDWKQSEWWDELVAEVRHEKGEELDANLTKLIDSSFEQAQDRVENGDYRVTKDGKLIRVPMGGRDLVIAGATVYDKQRLHRNEPTSIKSDSSSSQATLAFLGKISDKYHEALDKIAQEQQIRQVNSIDGECEEVENPSRIDQANAQ